MEGRVHRAVLGLRQGEFLHREVVEDEEIGQDVAAKPALPGPISAPTAQVLEEMGGLGEEHVVTGFAGLEAQGLSSMGFPDANGAAQEDGQMLRDELAGGQVPELARWGLGVEGEVELLEALQRLEVCPLDL